MEDNLKHEAENIIDQKNYGAVLASAIYENALLVYFETEILLFYDIIYEKIIKIIPVAKGLKLQECIFNYYFSISCDKEHIFLHFPNKDVCMILHPLYSDSEKELREINIGNGWFFQYGFGNHFHIFDYKKTTGFSGKHNNWVTGACLIGNKLYTVGHDGCIKQWNILDGEYIGGYALKKGWITSICNTENELFVGTQYGAVFKMDISSIGNPCDMGAIWNVYEHKNNIYSASEDGSIVLYNGKLIKEKQLFCSEGWINALCFDRDKIWAGTSEGEIISVDNGLNKKELICKFEKWINSLCVKENIIYFITAEGDLILWNMDEERYEEFKVSDYQLIDMLYVSRKLIVADVEGGIYCFDVNMKIEWEIHLYGLHITSLCIDKMNKKLYAGALDHAVGIVDLNEKTYHILDVGKGRVWKVDFSQEMGVLVMITTQRKIYTYDGETMRQICFNSFLTTCRIVGGEIILGNNKGNITKCFIKAEGKDIKKKVIKNLEINSEIYKEINNKIVLMCDKSGADSQIVEKRDKKILEMCGFSYEEMDVGNDKDLKNQVIRMSGWTRFPQILFYGHFISSESVLPQMYATGTLRRCVNNYRKIWK